MLALSCSPFTVNWMVVLPRIMIGLPLAAVTSRCTGTRLAFPARSFGRREWSHPVSIKHGCILPFNSTSMYVSGLAFPHAAPFAAAVGVVGAGAGAGEFAGTPPVSVFNMG